MGSDMVGMAIQASYGLGEGCVLLSVSGRSFWQQWLGWAVPNLVGLSPVSVRPWRGSATGTAAVGRAGTSGGVRGVVRVEAERTGAERGPGAVGIDGSGRVLCVRVDGVHAVNGTVGRQGRDAF